MQIHFQCNTLILNIVTNFILADRQSTISSISTPKTVFKLYLFLFVATMLCILVHSVYGVSSVRNQNITENPLLRATPYSINQYYCTIKQACDISTFQDGFNTTMCWHDFVTKRCCIEP